MEAYVSNEPNSSSSVPMPAMSQNRVIEIARGVAEEQGWPWIEPVEIARHRMFPWFWRHWWHVRTSSKFGTRSVYVQIDDSNGRLLQVAYSPY
jgi:hypothetical protein